MNPSGHGRFSPNGVSEAAHALDLEFHDITGLEEAPLREP
jgi:hypothetical protein